MIRLFTDQMGRTVRLKAVPKRILSLVPSQTELLHDLGLDEEVVGITKFCIRPDRWFREKNRVGGTKQLHLETIAALQPDLIIGNKEENEQAQIETLMRDHTVWMSDIRTLEEAYTMMLEIGRMTEKELRAEVLTGEIRKRFSEFRAKPRKKRTCLYFIWQEPFMCAGRDTFIDHLLETCGFTNLARKAGERYPEFTADELKQLAPDTVLLSSEPFPFSEKHRTSFHDILPGSEILTVDGEMFSWYGSRLLKAPAYFEALLAGNIRD